MTLIWLFLLALVAELASLANYLTKEKSLDRTEARKKAEECRAEMASLKAEMNAVKERYPELAANRGQDRRAQRKWRQRGFKQEEGRRSESAVHQRGA